MKLSEIEKKMVNRLQLVTFLPASFDKWFCLELTPEADYTEKQIAYMRKCFHKYRRQIKDYKTLNNQ